MRKYIAAFFICLGTFSAGAQDSLYLGFNIRKDRHRMGEAVSTIRGSALETVPSSSISQILEGRLSGLQTFETNSDPGNESVMKYIRGLSSFSGNIPVFVIDGIVMQAYNIEYISPEEIESVSILKDAASTAIYGLRGAHGVILINTRRPSSAKFGLDVKADFSLRQVSIPPYQPSSYKYAMMRNEGWRNDGSLGLPPFSDESLAKLASGRDKFYPDNNWYSKFVRPFASMSRFSVSVSGGDKKTRAWSNINVVSQSPLMRQETKVYRSAPQRLWINFRAKVEVDISKRVNAQAQIAGNIRNDILTGGGHSSASLYPLIFQLPPTMPGPLTQGGDVVTVETVDAPLFGVLNRSGYDKYTGMYASTMAGIKVDLGFITKGLSLSGKLSFQSSNDRHNYSIQDYARYYYDYVSGAYIKSGKNLNTSLSNSVGGRFQYAVGYIATADYERRFNKHSLSAHLYSYFTSEQFDKVSEAYPAVGFPHYNHNSGFSIGYDYDGKYVFSAVLGLSGSDVLPSKNRYAFVPSLSTAWILSEETFLKKAEWLDFLKLRLSFGITASDAFENDGIRYLYADYIAKNGYVNILGNENLAAERHGRFNAGFEAKLFGGLSLGFDIFKNRTDNMLIDMGSEIPSYYGILPGSQMKINKGSLASGGWEASLSYEKSLGKDWKVFTGIDYSRLKNSVLNCGEKPYPDGYKYPFRKEGFPIGQLWGYRTEGYISNDAELAKYVSMYEGIGVPRLGDFKYKDLNEDGKVNEKDMAPVGNGYMPSGWTSVKLGAAWKNIELSLLFTGIDTYIGTVAYNTERTYNGVFNDLHERAWTKERAASGEAVKSPALSYNYTSTSSLPNDWNIADRSFWRLKHASLSYSLPKKAIGKKLETVRLTLSGQNLLTFSAMESSFIDPEKGGMTELPSMRVINIGVKIGF